MATLRTISQTGREANWKKDKQVQLASLEDWQFYTFDDLDFMNRSKTIVASFPNFTTDDIIQTEQCYALGNDRYDSYEPGEIDRLRVYYKAVGSDWSNPWLPGWQGELIQSASLGLSLWQEGVYDSIFPGYDLQTLKKKVYPIHELGVKQAYLIDYSIGSCAFVQGSNQLVLASGNTDSIAFFLDAINPLGREFYITPQENNYLPEDTYITSVIDSTTIEVSEVALGGGVMTCKVLDKFELDSPFAVLKSSLEDPDGLEWTDEYNTLNAPSYQWQVQQDAPFEDDITINDARFLELDKKFRGDL